MVDVGGGLVGASNRTSTGSRLAVSSVGLAPGEVLTVAASATGAKLLAPPPPLTGNTGPLLRFIAALMSRGAAAGAAAGVVAIVLAYILLKATTRERPELLPR